MARTPPGHRDRWTPAESRNPFTSDLSVNEFVLIENAGFEPLGLVLGTSIYQLGFQWARWDRNQEMTALSQALYDAREMAMTRMEEEADALGADGIVGVRLEVRKAPWTRHVTEFFAVGTAVRDIHGVSHRTVHNRPFTSALSGQEFWLLMQHGYRPVSMVLGNAVYHIAWRNVANSLWACIVVVGTGGTGGYVIQYLCRLLYALSSSQNIHVSLTVMDGDTVEEGNLLRQHFLTRDVGRPKASVLADRFGAIYELPVMAVPQYLTSEEGLDEILTSPLQSKRDVWPDRRSYYENHPLDIVIGCVDNHATRQLLDRIFNRFAHLVYIDAGNDGVYLSEDPAETETVRSSGYGGHVVVGVKSAGQVELPPVGSVFPDILTDTESSLPGQACGQQAISQPQRMITNVWAAMTVVSAVNSILADKMLTWHVANFNAQNAAVRSEPLTASYYGSVGCETPP